MADNHNSQGPEGNYDPAGSTQMFRAFVEEAAPTAPTTPGSRMQQRAARQSSGSSTAVRLGLAVALLLVIGAVAWLALS
ncbi:MULTISPECIES: hypothetical protein [unclassified Streptomyces]|uniref:hypothetical protein n=1 Tax=unclassified Streptomyces TaxID=2593676 RepID=UPI00225C33AF|nr:MULTISPECIES: hypothetical protein [unclassified Streptomyces]MCX4526712.1 hypothetical protein [Streptomyces sp. NBC_01551]MCX4542726.1 hypothetical protein [Streptomyces sp. NBC_01565]